MGSEQGMERGWNKVSQAQTDRSRLCYVGCTVQHCNVEQTAAFGFESQTRAWTQCLNAAITLDVACSSGGFANVL